MKFKDDVISIRFEDMNKTAQNIALDMDEFCQKRFGKELTLTATVSTSAEDKLLGRTSDTHRTRRAWDIRTSNLEDNEIEELIEYTTSRYGRFGAIASATPQIIVYKPHGTGPHLHCQLNRKYALKEIKYV